MRSMVHKAFHQIRESGRVRLFHSERPEFADGEQRRDFLYVKDAVAMTLHAAEHAGVRGIVNVGSGQAHTWIELVSAVFDAMDVRRHIEFVEMPASLRGKYQYSTRAVIDRLRQSGFDRAPTPLAAADRRVRARVPDPGSAPGRRGRRPRSPGSPQTRLIGHAPGRRHRSGRGRYDGRDLRRGRRRRDAAAGTHPRWRPQDPDQRRRPVQHPSVEARRVTVRHRLAPASSPPHLTLVAPARANRVLRAGGRPAARRRA